MKNILCFFILAMLGLPSTLATAAERQIADTHLSQVIAKLHALGHMTSTNHLNLSVWLPLRNREDLTNFLRQVSDPDSPNFRHYLTPGQFTEKFGPSKQDYQTVIDFLNSQGLAVTGLHSNRTLVDFGGSVVQIEKAFHVHLMVYNHPSEARTFYAPDGKASIDASVPILEVNGLDNYHLPHPMYHRKTDKLERKSDAKPAFGSGPGGTLIGNDFRAAYLPGITLPGAGQSVGLFEIDGYYTNDITQYASIAGLTNGLTITNVLVDGFSGNPGSYNTEVALDIEMVMSMAPGATIIVYESTYVYDLIERMASDNLAKQLSCSWNFSDGLGSTQIYQQMAAQGQTFFMAAGDNGPYDRQSDIPTDQPYVTTVGGTTLTTGTNGSFVSETAWNWAMTGEGTASTGGGVSAVVPIPVWQQGIDMTNNGGSATMRNMPDVAMVADNIFVVANNGQQEWLGGTSFATPLWAAFTALVNQQATAQGGQPVGFINPVFYALGKNPSYRAYFHDVVSGNSTNSGNPTKYFAVPGYDLCTGWGSPQTNLIDALVNFPTLPPTNLVSRYIHVPQDYPTIQAALNAASFVAHDTILVGPGVYNESVNFNGKAARLIGMFGPNTTIISPPMGMPAVSFMSGETSNSVVSNFSMSYGGVLVSYSSPTISFNQISNAVTGISSYMGSPQITGNLIVGSLGNGINNHLSSGGAGCAIYLAGSGTALVQGNTMSGNQAGIAMFASGSPSVIDNLIANNQGDGINMNNECDANIIQNVIQSNSGTGIYAESTYQSRGPWVINNTIANNGESGVWIDAFDANDCEIDNNIVIGSPALNLFPLNAAPPYVVKYNDFYSVDSSAYLSFDLASTNSTAFNLDGVSNTSVYGNFSANPFFACSLDDDCHLVTGSPCIAAGTDLVPLFPTVDFDGLARNPVFNPSNVADLGAYEYNSTAPPTPCLYLNCPSNIVTTAVLGKNSAVVSYPAPDATPSATLTCIPASGSIFPAGTNVVVCTLVYSTNVIINTFTVTVLVTPYITNQPSIISVLANSNAMITVGVVGTPPLNFQWSFNSAVIANTANGTLIVSNAQSVNEGIYSVVVSDNLGTASSSSMFLRVIPAAATIVSDPASFSIFAGNQAIFNPTVIGSAPLYFQWYKDGAMLAGDNSPQLVIPNAQAADAGQYQILVSNILGTAVSPAATLNVLPAIPSFTLQPVSASGLPGDSVTFESQAIGSDDGLDPIRYSWYFQSNAIPGQTSAALSLAAIAPTNQGAYFVVATNIYGASTSVVVQLTVFQAPSLVAGLSNLVVDAGKSIVLNPSANGTPPLAYNWGFNLSQLTNTSPSLLLSNVIPSQSGFYSVTVTNQFGAISSTGRVSVFQPESQIMAWGDDTGGQIDVPTNLCDAVAVAGGEYHSIAIRHDGSLVGWGLDDEGQIDVPTNSLPFVVVAAGANHNLAIAEDGSIVAWGLDDSGQVDVPTSVSSVLSVAAGDSHSLALLSSGIVIAWGDNTYGQTTLPLVLTGYWWYDWRYDWYYTPPEPALAIAAGNNHSLALLTNGLVVAWGDNSFGQATPPSNLSNVVAVTAGYLHSVALRSNGTVVAWGDDSFGQTNVPAGLSNVVAIAAGDFHTLALLSNGNIVGWGNDSLGQLDTPAGLTNAVGIASGYYTGMALVAFKAFLQANMTSAGLLIRWNGTGVLQWASTPEGPYTDLPSQGNVWTNFNMSAHARFFRLRSQ
jgi:parallel beta-helix repeat protein